LTIGEENARLRKLVADLTRDKEMLSEVIKKAMTATRGREMIDFRPNLLSHIGKTRLPRRTCLSCDLPLPLASAGSDTLAQTDQRDRRDAGALWLPAYPNRSQAGGLASEC